MVTENTSRKTKDNPQGSSKNQIKHVIGVISAKGGVGKSFVAGLLACELTKKGYRVGILDANSNGSSIPLLFGLHVTAERGESTLIPLYSQLGIKLISMDTLFNNEDQSLIWQESLLGEVVSELFTEIEWGSLDYLLVDMPPGTSEAAVDILQSLPFKGLIVISTPQMLVNKIAKQAISVMQRIGVPVLGIVENMAYYRNLENGKKEYIFGQNRAESLAILTKSPLLAQLALETSATKLCDSGNMEEVVVEGSSDLVETFLESLDDFDEKASALASENQNGGMKSAYSNGQWVVEEDPFSNYRHPSLVTPARKSFSEIAINLIRSKENVGELVNPDAQGHFLGSCGDRMQIDLKIEEGRISEARFQADGCGATLACGSMITKLVCSLTLDQAAQISSEDLLLALGGLPDDHEHCAELAVMTLRDAVIDAQEGHRSIPKN